THEAGRLLARDRRTAVFWQTALREEMIALRGYDRACEESVRVVADDEPMASLPYPTVTPGEIADKPSAYSYSIIFETTYRIAAIEAGRAPDAPRSAYFHADGNPLSDSDPVLHRWFYYFGIDYHNHSTGGHADPASIEAMVREIDPAVVVPLHSRQPSLLASPGIPRHLPFVGERITLEELVAKGGDRRTAAQSM
ncbi:MAG: hypothetical protein ACOC1U_02090, partial [Spirochaetota bacterium]